MSNEYYVWDEGTGSVDDHPIDHGHAVVPNGTDHEGAVQLYMATRDETYEGELEVFCSCKETGILKRFNVRTELEPTHYIGEISD